jgi:hypothetical protein
MSIDLFSVLHTLLTPHLLLSKQERTSLMVYPVLTVGAFGAGRSGMGQENSPKAALQNTFAQCISILVGFTTMRAALA